MIDRFSRRSVLVSAAAMLAACAAPVRTATYPSKPVRIVYPFPPGGSTEAAAKVLAARLAALWGSQVTAESIPGDLGEKAMREVARGDGHVLMVGSWLTNVYGVAVRRANTPFEYMREIVPVARFLEQPWVFVVATSNPSNSVREVFDAARRSGGKVMTGADFPFPPGTDLDAIAIQRATGVEVVRVPTTGGATGILADLAAGKTQYTYLNPILATQAARDGRVKPLAVSGTQRLAAIPQLPTLEEAGLPGAGIPNWHGVFAPRTMKSSDLSALHAAVQQALGGTEAAGEFAKIHGRAAISASPEVFARELEREAAPFPAVRAR